MIKEFKGEYRWLSNFYPVEIKWDNLIFPSVEHAYQSCKSLDGDWKALCSGNTTPGKIKRLSKSICLPNKWTTNKVKIMWNLLELKFYQEPFKSLLLDTGNMRIQEGNLWGDTFWGVSLDTGVGKNMLGIMIMQIRDGLRFQRFF